MLSDNPIGQPFIHLDVVQSTNNYAMAQVQAQMAAHGKTWYANHQTAGKGQRGKAWTMEAGQNIIMSIVFDTASLQLVQQFQLSAVVAMGCHDFFSKYALDETTIKWPNDLYWKDRKAGGILIENLIQGKDWKYAVVGIGININQTTFKDDLRNPVSLKQITGFAFDALELAKELCSKIEQRWRQLLNDGFKQIMQQYNSVLYKRNQSVVFKKEASQFKALVTGVNDVGQLQLKEGDELINHGEVEWVLP